MGSASTEEEVTVVFARWYVRGLADSHVYDRKVPVLPEYAGQAFCQTCLIVHPPVSSDWHIEAPDVDRMLCGIFISLDEGEGRRGAPKNVCSRCAETAGEGGRS